MGLDEFLRNFDFKAQKDMKIDSKELIKLLKNGEAILVDVRFREEYEVWNIKPSVNIPLNELPDRWEELKGINKLIVVACPHSQRSAIAMTYLLSKGIKTKFLADGLLTMVNLLKGEAVKDFLKNC